MPIRNGALDARSSDGIGGGPDTLPRYNVSLGRSRLCFKRWLGNSDLPALPGAIAPERGRCKEKTVINARVEKVLIRRYFRHMFREGEGNDFGKRDLK